MITVTFRFYEELNDHLPADRRKRDFDCPCPGGATVKHAIERLGVPHTEVELILVNGESVGFEHVVRDGDRVSVYPQFESVDVTPLVRLRPKPLRRTRFFVDAHLARLARLLRLLGFDTRLRAGESEAEFVAAAVAERRILLTRSRALLMRREVTHGCHVAGDRPLDQCVRILDRLDLRAAARPLHALSDLQRSAGEGREGGRRRPPGQGYAPPLRGVLALSVLRSGLLARLALAADGGDGAGADRRLTAPHGPPECLLSH